MTKEEAKEFLETIAGELGFTDIEERTWRDGEKMLDAIEVLWQEPFTNKPCVAHQVCHEDKIKVLDKIRAEIRKLDDINPDYSMDRTIHISRNEVLEIIDKYKSESEE